MWQKDKDKPMFYVPQAMSGQGSLGLVRQSQSESEQFWVFLTMEETPEGKPRGIDYEGWNISYILRQVSIKYNLQYAEDFL